MNFCTLEPEKCPDTLNGINDKNTATDGYPSWIYHFGYYLNDKLVVDLPSCPYTEKDDGEDYNCEGME